MGLERIGERLECPTSLSKEPLSWDVQDLAYLSTHAATSSRAFYPSTNSATEGENEGISSCNLEELRSNDPYGRLLQNAGFWNAKVSDFIPLLVEDGR